MPSLLCDHSHFLVISYCNITVAEFLNKIIITLPWKSKRAWTRPRQSTWVVNEANIIWTKWNTETYWIRWNRWMRKWMKLTDNNDWPKEVKFKQLMHRFNWISLGNTLMTFWRKVRIYINDCVLSGLATWRILEQNVFTSSDRKELKDGSYIIKMKLKC
jgi:hypothetical protein